MGKGSFGAVYVVDSCGMRLAAKRSNISEESRAVDVKMMRREALAMRSLSHTNVVQIIGVVLDAPEYIALLMEVRQLASTLQPLGCPLLPLLCHLSRFCADPRLPRIETVLRSSLITARCATCSTITQR